MKKILLVILMMFYFATTWGQLKNFKVEIPIPAKYKLSDSIQSVTIMNRSMSPAFQRLNEDSLQLSFYRKHFETNYLLLDSTVADTTIKALGELLFESNRFDIVIPVERNIPRTEFYNQTPEKLDWEFVKAICDQYQTDALIVLENLTLRVVTNYDKSRERTNIDYPIAHFASMDFYYRAHWRIYEPNNKNIVVDFIRNQDTNYYDNVSYDLVELFEGLPTVLEAAIETGIKTAIDFCDFIAPIWQEETRYYYITNKKEIDRSVTLAAQGNWQEALNNWLLFAEEGNRNNQSKVMLNVALGYEMVGDLDSAIMWAKKSLDTYYREVTNHYLKELLKRDAKMKSD